MRPAKGREYIGRYKAESLDAFERLTLKKPDFDMGFYFLGYGYLNLGLYVKAKLTWETFMELSENQEQKDEVAGWLEKAGGACEDRGRATTTCWPDGSRKASLF